MMMKLKTNLRTRARTHARAKAHQFRCESLETETGAKLKFEKINGKEEEGNNDGSGPSDGEEKLQERFC